MARIGVVGLGTMGAALALNIADSGFDVAVYNRTSDATQALMDRAGDLAPRMTAASDHAELVAALEPPRAVLVMVPAGSIVDDVIETLLEHLEPGDMIIDGGNANFSDTRRREADLAEKGFSFFGMGVSGGEEGARHGPSIMVGGPEDSFERVRDIIEAIAANYQGTPCAAHLGPDGAGHFVKTVHNGIEYADMELIAEVYGLMRGQDGRAPSDIAEVFAGWNEGPLYSYLTEITAKVLAATDPVSGAPMTEMIVDSAGQKGTGRWTVIEGLKLGQSASAIEAAVGARSWSAGRTARQKGEALFGAEETHPSPVLDVDLERALLAGRIIAFSQGLSLLKAASDHYEWDVDLARTAEIWRAGCIIRSALLDTFATAFRGELPGGELILAPPVRARLE
ncbi:MAG: NADP-dependent phosphogluconate dehydrogenase, partial [Alphaproteobacteria bacterium]|nr:NADP-dependent phosphogluconate dehydrogenase [Alphaproteobacteria bacterium]